MTRRQEYIVRAVFLVVILYSAAWFVLATQMEKRLLHRLAAEQEHGVTITWKRHRTAGFPFEMRVLLRDFSLADKSGLTVSAPNFSLGAALGDINDLTLRSPAGMFVTVPAGQQRPALKAAISTVQGRIRLDASRLDTLSLTLDNVLLVGLLPDARAVTTETLSVYLDRPEDKPVNAMDPAGHLIVNADNTTLPDPAVPALGNAVRRVTLDAYLLGDLTGMDQQAVKAWRDAGGTVNMEELSAEWGPLGIGLGGTLALDNDFQPLGSFSAKVTGFVPALDALVAERGINPDKASLIKAGLGLIARPEGDGDIPTLTVPLTVQDRALYLASFKVVKLPEVRVY